MKIYTRFYALNKGNKYCHRRHCFERTAGAHYHTFLVSEQAYDFKRPPKSVRGRKRHEKCRSSFVAHPSIRLSVTSWLDGWLSIITPFHYSVIRPAWIVTLTYCLFVKGVRWKRSTDRRRAPPAWRKDDDKGRKERNANALKKGIIKPTNFGLIHSFRWKKQLQDAFC